MLAFFIGLLFAFLILFLLTFMSILRALFKIDQLSIMPIRYLWSLLTSIITIIFIVVGMWLIFDILTLYFNIDIDEMGFGYLLAGFLVGYIPAAFLSQHIITFIKKCFKSKQNTDL